MSIDSARDFIKRMESDQKFAIKIQEFHNLEEIIAYATRGVLLAIAYTEEA